MRTLAQMHATTEVGPPRQAELVAALREEMKALQRERLALLQAPPEPEPYLYP